VASAPPGLLQPVGVASDSAGRLVELLQAARVPLTAVGEPDGRRDESVSLIGRVDHAPFDWRTMQPSTTSFGVTGYAKWSRAVGQGLAPTGKTGHGGGGSQAVGMLQGERTMYLRTGHLAGVSS